MSSGKKRAQHLASGKADMNDQVREDKDGLTRRRGEAREAGAIPGWDFMVACSTAGPRQVLHMCCPI